MSANHPTSGVILFGHGSRDPLWRNPLEAVAARIALRHPQLQVACAYLELCEPALAQVLEQWAALSIRRVSILPMLLGSGRHAREDLPVMVQNLRKQYPLVAIELQPLIGEDSRMTELMAQIAIESIS